MTASAHPAASCSKSPRIRFSPAISSPEISPDRSSYFNRHSSGSGSDSSDVKAFLLPKPVRWQPRRRDYGGWWRENWGNVSLIAALVGLSVVFAMTVWENEGWCESIFLFASSEEIWAEGAGYFQVRESRAAACGEYGLEALATFVSFCLAPGRRRISHLATPISVAFESGD